MTKRERVERTFRLEKTDRIPFVPALYEHKGALIGKSPSEICRNGEYLYTGLKRELQVYDTDMLVVGIDVYNVEAEAMGCKVVYFEDSNDCPGIVNPLIGSSADLDSIHIPDPETDGRMPLYLGVAEILFRELGKEMIIRGALTGPFSMACALAGAEDFLIACIEEPLFARKLIFLCAQTAVAFGKAFLRRGVEPILFDSRATPVLASPYIFRELLKPVYRDYLFPELKSAGGRFMPLIIGGDTLPIIDDLVETGANQLLCDHPADLESFRKKCLSARLPFRANIDARLLNAGPISAIRRRTMEVLECCGRQPGFMLGCGIIGYDCPSDHVHAIRQVLDAF